MRCTGGKEAQGSITPPLTRFIAHINLFLMGLRFDADLQTSSETVDFARRIINCLSELSVRQFAHRSVVDYTRNTWNT